METSAVAGVCSDFLPGGQEEARSLSRDASSRGSAVRCGAEGEMVAEGCSPTRYHRSGDTENLDLEVNGPLPTGSGGATRVEG